MAFFSFCLVIGLWLAWWAIASLPCFETEKMGQLGDWFGAFNALFSALAFGGVAVSILLQVHERAQRDKERLEEICESRVFEIWGALRDLTSSMNFENPDHSKRARGRDVFESFYGLLEYQYGINSEIDPTKKIIRSYNAVYAEKQDDLGPYFRVLYHIFKYIDEAKVSDRQKHDLSELVRAEFSSAEVIFIAVNGLGPHGGSFTRLIQKYHLLKHLPYPLGIDPEDEFIRVKYHPSAFDDDTPYPDEFRDRS